MSELVLQAFDPVCRACRVPWAGLERLVANRDALKRRLEAMNVVHTIIRSFVEKCGGLKKCEELLVAMRDVPDAKRAAFIRGSAKTDAGARQLMALALLGLITAIEVTKKEAKENPTC